MVSKDYKLMVKFPQSTREALRLICEQDDLRITQVVRRAITTYISQHKHSETTTEKHASKPVVVESKRNDSETTMKPLSPKLVAPSTREAAEAEEAARIAAWEADQLAEKEAERAKLHKAW